MYVFSQVQLIRTIIREEGLRGLYRGTTGLMLRDVPGYLVFFISFGACNKILANPGEDRGDMGEMAQCFVFVSSACSSVEGGVVRGRGWVWSVGYGISCRCNQSKDTGIRRYVGCVIFIRPGG